ncbi:GOT1 [Cordylochernes scorpioides]|uniref:Aspartate aminotransferase n=1 Tax=Cordylochernes scorpioides TaxID=51811 RepID=A0ABY6KEX6_9ARAC|nr:GOT1 [Cordylochernes scorpioides]
MYDNGVCLQNAPRGSAVVLHMCAHNPTGVDPTPEQWRAIADVVADRGLLPFFDCTYQGLASGDLDQDAFPVRMFVDRGLEVLCAQSFSKNFGLYNERAATLLVVSSSQESSGPLQSVLEELVAGNYCSPPLYGARVVQKVWTVLRQQWKSDLVTIHARIKAMKELLHQRIVELGIPGFWDHFGWQSGWFVHTGLSEYQVSRMTQQFHIHMAKDGRASLCGLTPHNVDYVARAIASVVNTDSS